jgi:hypothetical protein
MSTQQAYEAAEGKRPKYNKADDRRWLIVWLLFIAFLLIFFTGLIFLG